MSTRFPGCNTTDRDQLTCENRILAPADILDDQPGSFPCVNKAYGPCKALRVIHFPIV